MKKFLIFVFLILYGLSLPGLELEDYGKAAPVLGKIILPLLMIPEMVTDTDSIITGTIGLGLFTLPNSFLLYNIITENPSGTSFWRNVTIYTDSTVGLATLGGGIYLLSGLGKDPSGWDPLVGGLFIAMSAAIFGAVGIDTLSYSFE